MHEDEWRRRFAARIMEVTKWPDKPAMDYAASIELTELDDEFRDNPELAADEEMSCWTDDGDE